MHAAAADCFEQLVRLAADALSVQTGTPAHAPSNQIVAGALISLWRLHLSAMLQAGDRSLSVKEARDHVRHEVDGGAELVVQLIRAAAQPTSDHPRRTDR